MAIDVTEYGDGRNTEAFCCGDDSARDFSSIGDQEFVNGHRRGGGEERDDGVVDASISMS